MKTADRLSKSGIKKTRQRLALLDILECAKGPLTAAQIHSLYQKKDRGACLSTTYRTLEVLTENGIVNRIMPMDGACACYKLNTDAHKHYAICKGCSRMIDLERCPMENARLSVDNFHVTGHRLEIYGYCDDCYLNRKT